MRGLVFLIIMGLAAAVGSPASAQMCGGGQNATQTQATGSSGMCGMGAATAPAAGQQQIQAQATSGCSCCQRMAMMQPPAGGQGAMSGGMMGGQGTSPAPQDTMPNMQMPAPGGPGSPAPGMPNP
jgi:hypothetical protein